MRQAFSWTVSANFASSIVQIVARTASRRPPPLLQFLPFFLLSVLAEDAIKAALKDYRTKNNKASVAQ